MKILLITVVKWILYPFKEIILSISKEMNEKLIFNKGLILSKKNTNKKKINNLSNVEFSSFSQWGDDGIIDWLIYNLKIKDKRFIEIGVQDYWESNTRFLLKKRNWDGLLIDMSKKDIKNIKSQSIYWRYNLLAKNYYVTAENINKIISENNFDKKISLFSLDIDGNDYWILKNLNVRPEIIVCEYNGLFGDINKITVPYKKTFNREKEHYSNLYFGCSIKSLTSLLKLKGYIFIGSNSSGNNAYFVKKAKFKHLINKLKTIKVFKPKFRESRNLKNKKTFLNYKDSLIKIRKKKILDLDNNKMIKIESIKKFYSKKYLIS